MTQEYAPATLESGKDARERIEGGSDRSIGAIVTDLWEKIELIVRQEMKLGIAVAEEKIDSLKVELEDRGAQLKLELTAKAIGGVVAFAGSLVIAAAIVLLLAVWMKPWLAALLVGVALSAAGAFLLKRDIPRIKSIAPGVAASSGSIQFRTPESNTRETNHDTAQ